MASTLYENVEDWHTIGESKDVLSSDETEQFSFKEDLEDHDDGYEEVSPKQNLLKEITDKNSHVETETAKENGHAYSGNAVNGNGIHEKHSENPCNDDDGEDGGNEKDDIVNDGEENDSDRASPETNEDEPVPQVPYYGRTLVAPEYMNFQLPEEISQREKRAAEDDDDNEIAASGESDDLVQVENYHDEVLRAEEESSGRTVQKEVLEEDDLTLSEEESDEDEDDNVEEEDRRARDDCQDMEKHEKKEEVDEEGEEEDQEEKEGKEKEEEIQEDTAGEDSKLTPENDHEGSPQLAQAEEDDEEQSEDDGLEEENEDVEAKEGSLLKEDGEVEEKESTEECKQRTTQNETCLNLAEADDDDDNDEEIENEDTETTKHSDSLKVHVASPTRDICEVGSAAESFEEGEGLTSEDDNGDKVQEQAFTAKEQSLNKSDEEDEERRKTFNGSVEEYESQQNKDVEGEKIVREDYCCRSEDTEEDSNDESAAIDCVPDQDEAKGEHTFDDDNADGSVDLDTIPEGEDAESDREAQDEEYSVHVSSQGHDDESNLTGKVKELGRMFEGGGPVFPKAVKNDTDAVDGSPVSVRRYKAIFEQDRLSAERAREPGRREELTGPPRGIVKNLRGLFENPQGFEARKG